MSENKLNNDEAIDQMKRFKELLKEASKNTEEVKSGELTPEDEQESPEYILFDNIADCCISSLQMEPVIEIMNKLADKFGDDIASDLCSMMALVMANSAFNAIAFYDKLVSKLLAESFNSYNDALNDTIARVDGINSAMEVFKRKFEDLRK